MVLIPLPFFCEIENLFSQYHGNCILGSVYIFSGVVLKYFIYDLVQHSHFEDDDIVLYLMKYVM